MGASSSTIKDTIRTTFGRADVGKKGYLVSGAGKHALRCAALFCSSCACCT